MEPISHMNDTENKDWVIVCSQSLGHYVHCICGHRVKRITYLYHKPSKAIQYVGKTCVRKYGIQFSLTNPILLDVIKANLDKAEWDRDACVREHILSQYTTFMTMALTQESSDISVNTVVGPFRRLLSDVCDLVSEFNFDLVDVLRDIEREVESLNQTTRHQMVDEYSLCDSISEIASEHTDITDEEVVESIGSEHVVEDIEDEPVSDIIVEDPIEDEPVSDIIVENPIEDEPVSDIIVENPIEDEPVSDIVEDTVIVEPPVDEVVAELVEGVVKSLEESVKTKETVIERFLRTTSNINIEDTDVCSATTHCYCAMKYRMRLLHQGIEELRINVEKHRKETQELIQGSREQRMKTDEYLERSRKAHPELFGE